MKLAQHLEDITVRQQGIRRDDFGLSLLALGDG